VKVLRLFKVKRVTVEESEKLYKLLIKHGIPERAARNLIKIYEKG
jgi:hypothetical protein